jgi:hypothetical protein
MKILQDYKFACVILANVNPRKGDISGSVYLGTKNIPAANLPSLSHIFLKLLPFILTLSISPVRYSEMNIIPFSRSNASPTGSLNSVSKITSGLPPSNPTDNI